MNIKEAVVSGREFKRPFYSDWLYVDARGTVVWERSRDAKTFDAADLLADDWELKPRKVKKTGYIPRHYLDQATLEVVRDYVEVTWEEEE